MINVEICRFTGEKLEECLNEFNRRENKKLSTYNNLINELAKRYIEE